MKMKMNKVSPRQVLIALAIATVIYIMFSNNKKSMYSVKETMYAPSGYGGSVGPSEPLESESEPGTACEMKAGTCLLYTSDAADDSLRVDLGGRRIIKNMTVVYSTLSTMIFSPYHSKFSVYFCFKSSR